MNLSVKCERLTNTDRKLICLALLIYADTKEHRAIGKNKNYNKLVFIDIEQIHFYLNALYKLVVNNEDKWIDNDSILSIRYPNTHHTKIVLHKEWRYLIKHKEDIWDLITKLVKS